MGALAAALVVAALVAGPAAESLLPYWVATTTTVRPEEACHLPCRCLRLSRWTPRLRAHCLVVWNSDTRPHPPFQLDTAVDDVDFARSKIRKLYAVHLQGLERIKVIHMNGVGLVSITTNAFDDLSELWSLSLELNYLTSLSPHVLSRNGRLHYLSLRRNLLAVRPDEPLLGAKSVEVLDVSECGIDAVYSATFRLLPNLRQLHLERNLLTTLPAESVAPVAQLTRLFLQQNRLVLFPSDAIKSLPQLLEVRLERNLQMQGPLGPLEAPRLQRLMASDCALQSVQPNLLMTAPELRYLEAAGNRLRTLWLANESSEAHLVLLDVARNPLECDCALRDTCLWAEEHVDVVNVFCGDPPRIWQNASLHKLDCDRTPGAMATTEVSASTAGGEAGAVAMWVSLSLLGVLAAVGGALLVVYRQELLARFFSPQARAAASGGVDALPLERNHAEDVTIGLPQVGQPQVGQPQEGGVAPWLQ